MPTWSPSARLPIDGTAQVILGRLAAAGVRASHAGLLQQVGSFGGIVGDVDRLQEVASRLFGAAQRRRRATPPP